jgi:hypothetical protein
MDSWALVSFFSKYCWLLHGITLFILFHFSSLVSLGKAVFILLSFSILKSYFLVSWVILVSLLHYMIFHHEEIMIAVYVGACIYFAFMYLISEPLSHYDIVDFISSDILCYFSNVSFSAVNILECVSYVHIMLPVEVNKAASSISSSSPNVSTS